MILPAIDYSDVVYMTAIKTHINRLQQVVDGGVRTCIKNKGTINALKLRKVAKLNSLEERRDAHLLKKAFVVSLDADALDKRQIRTRVHDERLLKITRPKNPAYRKSLEYRVATTWNKLEISIRAIKDHGNFKKWIDKTLVDKLKLLPNI